MTDILDAPAEDVPSALRHQLVLVDGRTFSISDEDGRMWAPTHGVVHDDIRHLSRLDVQIDECSIELLASTALTPLSAVIVARVHHGDAQLPPGLLTIRRWVAGGLRQDVHLQNTSTGVGHWTVRITAAADFAHVFDVKAGKGGTDHAVAGGGGGLVIDAGDPGILRTDVGAFPPPDGVDASAGGMVWHLVVPPRSEATLCLTIEPVVDGEVAALAFPCDMTPADAVPMRRLEAWRSQVPVVVSDDSRIATIIEQALADLVALRIVDQAHPERVVIAAGAPWFMTLFGRDSLLTSWMTLPFDPTLAVGVLRTLAELQGTADDPRAEEQPGKILHKLRRHGGGGPFASRSRYYGTVDATPLFVMLVAEAWRWGALSPTDLEALAAPVDRALDWILGDGDSDQDGLIDYQRRDSAGLSNQGWKDSWDGVTAADGSMPSGPLALVEVQGYAYAALRGAAALAGPMGLARPAAGLDEAAARLRGRFNDAYWDERGWFALARDRGAHPGTPLARCWATRPASLPTPERAESSRVLACGPASSGG